MLTPRNLWIAGLVVAAVIIATTIILLALQRKRKSQASAQVDEQYLAKIRPPDKPEPLGPGTRVIDAQPVAPTPTMPSAPPQPELPPSQPSLNPNDPNSVLAYIRALPGFAGKKLTDCCPPNYSTGWGFTYMDLARAMILRHHWIILDDKMIQKILALDAQTPRT